MKKRERVILHSDLNNFFASVETTLYPELKGKPLAVCGDPKKRRGVVLAKNYEAKKYGIQTAETGVSALQKCPQLIMRPPRFKEYNRYSLLVQEIYARFTDRIDVCSIDECALDVTDSVKLFGSGKEIAEKIRTTVKEETGLTVSIGVSFNRAFAKLASELKKPDAVTEISKENYRSVVYPLPVSELFLVGKNTAETLKAHGIRTIGDLAQSDEEKIVKLLGKRGKQIRVYARGEDDSPVGLYGEKEEVKSIGNSMTLPKDVWDRDEIKRLFYVLSESVSARMREADVGKCDTVHIAVKDENLRETTKQKKVRATELCGDIAKAAFELYCAHFPVGFKAHLLGVSVSGFDQHIEQMQLGEIGRGEVGYDKRKRAEEAVAKIREKYGYETVQRGLVLEDESLTGLDIKGIKD